MTEQEMIAGGQALFKKCYGDVVPVPAAIDPKGYSGMTMKMFNDFWGDDRLSFRDKRLVVMGVLAGLGADPSLFTIHAKSALNNDEINADELRAIILMMLPYVGYPRASPLFLASEKLIAERANAGE
jgi:4-carboxymuconolactone decarboxylase